MFNPYTTRPIGSKKYEEHLLDVMTSAYFQNKINDDDDLLKLAEYGQRLWFNEIEEDPYETLAIAVTVQAVIDYIQYYTNWKKAQSKYDEGQEVLWHSRMIQIENEFFRQYDITETAFEQLLKILFCKDYESLKKDSKIMMRRIAGNYIHYKHDKEAKGHDNKNRS